MYDHRCLMMMKKKKRWWTRRWRRRRRRRRRRRHRWSKRPDLTSIASRLLLHSLLVWLWWEMMLNCAFTLPSIPLFLSLSHSFVHINFVFFFFFFSFTHLSYLYRHSHWVTHTHTNTLKQSYTHHNCTLVSLVEWLLTTTRLHLTLSSSPCNGILFSNVLV